MMMHRLFPFRRLLCFLRCIRMDACAQVAIAILLTWGVAHAEGWQPSEPIEFVVPAGQGGGADQMARLIASLVAKHSLLSQPIQVVNKTANSGVEGFLDLRNARGNPHKLIITLSNLFTTPLATGVDFNWRQLTPVSMMALDPFVLWVSAHSPYERPEDVIQAVRMASRSSSLTLGGTGSKQEDQLIGVLLETAAKGHIRYVPLKGGGDVAKALAAEQVTMTVNNPIEAEELWGQGKVRPLCVFSGSRLSSAVALSNGRSWGSIPTCMSVGIPIEYQMLRGIFMAPGVTEDQIAFYVELLAAVRTLPEWQEFMERGAYNTTTKSGEAFVTWLDRTENFHRVVMREAKLIAK
jgi:tripartite-type tricarboxylate transporter receptor subunit TctC